MTSEHDTYTEEEPNDLLPEEAGPYLALFREMHPAHFAMTYLGLITGLRPSSLRPLRRRGPEADVQWDTGRIYVRRSHSLGDETMKTTKQKRRYGINLPEEAMNILRWHAETQLRTLEQQDSDLLFPAITGGFRAPCVLNKPLAEVAEAMNLGKKITQRALRRTASDLHRDAETSEIVTKSITGWLTPARHELYSNVRGAEQRNALAKVIRLFSAPGGEHGGEHLSASGEQTKKAS